MSKLNAPTQKTAAPQQKTVINTAQQTVTAQKTTTVQQDPQVIRDAMVQTARQTFVSPLEALAVDMEQTVALTMPSEQSLVEAYAASEFELTDSSWKRSWKLRGCKKKFSLQQKLEETEADYKAQTQKPVAKEISAKEAMKLSDEDLVKKFGKIKVNDDYLTFRYRLLKNNYYSVLPLDEVKKTDRRVLIAKIRDLYMQDPRNDELIRYFQSVVNIQDYERAAKEKPKTAKQPKTKTLPPSAELKKQNLSGAEMVRAQLDKACLGQDELNKRITAMTSVMVPTSKERSWRGTEDDNINDSQKEGIREILAWMYRNCSKTSVTKEPFVYKLTQAPPEKLLLMFYLIENNMHEAPTAAVLNDAMTDYVPDLNTFKNKVVASKAKFWKRIGTDHTDRTIDWAKMGRMARFALGNEVAEDYGRYAKEIRTAEKELAKPENSADDKQRDLLLDLVSSKGNLLLTLYRSAGLHPDMPLNLVADQKLRTRIQTTLDEFRDAAGRLCDVLKKSGIADEKTITDKGKYDARGRQADKPESMEEESDWQEKVEIAETVTSVLHNGDDTLAMFAKLTASLREADAYAGTFGSIGTVTSILSLVSGLAGTVDFVKNFSSMSLADTVGTALGVGAQLTSGVNDFVSGGASVVGAFVNLGETGEATWLVEDTFVRTASTAFSSVAGGIQFCTGCVAIAAGGIQATAGGIQLCRGISTRRDVSRSKEQLEKAKKRANRSEEQVKDHEALERFLSHQKRSANDKMVSAGVTAVTGTMVMLGGALAVAGILAPLGGALAVIGAATNIGVGMILGRHLKHNTRKKAVDEALGVPKTMKDLRAVSEKAKNMKEKDLRRAIRAELLGALGYVNYEEYFAEICRQNAELLYKHVFKMPSSDPDYQMYLDALKSIGTKINIPKKQGDKPFPTVEVIYSKLMG